MSTEIVTWILLFINAIQYYYMIGAFFDRRIKSFWIGAFAYTLISAVMRVISSQFEGDMYATAAFVVVIMQVVILYPFFYIRKWYYAAFIEIGILIVMFLTQIPTIWLTELITGSNVMEQLNASDFNLDYVIATSLNCMLYMIYLFIIYIIRFVIRYSSSKTLLMSIILVGIYQLLVISFFYMLCWNNGESATYGGVLFVVFSILTDMAILISIENMLKKMNVEKEWNQLSGVRQQEYEYYESVQGAIEQFRLERHDYVNYIQVIEQLLEEPARYDEAQKIICVLKENYYGKEVQNENN